MSTDNLKLPRNVEAEQTLLGEILLEPGKVFPSLAGTIEARHFYKPEHRTIFRAMVDLSTSGAPLDIVSLSNRLEEKGNMEKAGGRIYLTELLDCVTTTASLDHYAEIIRKKALRRAIIEAGLEITELGRQEDDDDPAEKALELLREAVVDGLPANPSTWQNLADTIGPISWAWEKWLPAGLLTILAGAPGSGKSALALRIATTFLKGDSWPDGTPYNGEQGKILWCESEAAQPLNLDRARAWELPLNRILTPFHDPMIDIRLDDPRMRAIIERNAHDPDIRLVVVDSLSGSHRGDENAAQTISIVLSLATLARDTGKPVLLTHHLRKKSKFEGDEVTLERLRGSSAIVQPARVVWALDAPDATQEHRRRLSVIKSNLAAFPEPLGVEVDESGVSFGKAPHRPHTESQVEKAADLLLALLHKKPMPSVDLQKEADQAGISWDTFKRAKRKLELNAVKKDGHWIWSLPAEEKIAPF
jgi:replicative DNA helicase